MQRLFKWFLNFGIIVLSVGLVLALFLSMGDQNTVDFIRDMF